MQMASDFTFQKDKEKQKLRKQSFSSHSDGRCRSGLELFSLETVSSSNKWEEAKLSRDKDEKGGAKERSSGGHAVPCYSKQSKALLTLK